MITSIIILLIMNYGLVYSVCLESEYELMYTKRTGSLNNEGFNLYAPGSLTALYNSPLFEKNTIVTKTACIPKTDFYTYDIWSSMDWDESSYVEFFGSYGQTFFKGSHVKSDLSLVFYTPIPKNSLWFLLSNREMHWTDNEWDQGSTREVSADNIPTVVSGRLLYLRKVISIPTDVMAAYEIRVKYKHGIVLFVNGYEILRDNMHSGYISFDAVNINSYSTYDYRGTIRNGFELGSVSATIAMEIHANDMITAFDCWMSIYGSFWPKNYDEKIYFFPTNATVGAGVTYTDCTDFNYNSVLVINQIPSGFYFEYDLGLAQSNGFMYYVSSQYGKLTNVEIKGYSPFDGAWVTLSDGAYSPEYDSENCFRGSLYFRNFNKIRYYVKGVSSYPAGFNEFRPILWRVAFERTVAEVEDVIRVFTTADNIQEAIQDSSTFICYSLGSLPIGVSLASNCILSGKTKAVGSYAIPVMASDVFGPRYFTLYLSIDEEEEDEIVSYDESYKTAPIVITTIICVCVLIMTCISLYCLCSRYDFSPKKKLPIIKQSPSKKITDDYSSFPQVSVIPVVTPSPSVPSVPSVPNVPIVLIAGPSPPELPASKPSPPVLPTSKPSSPELPTSKPSPVLPTSKPSSPVLPSSKPSPHELPTSKPSPPVLSTLKPSYPILSTSEPSYPALFTSKPSSPTTLPSAPTIIPPVSTVPTGHLSSGTTSLPTGHPSSLEYQTHVTQSSIPVTNPLHYSSQVSRSSIVPNNPVRYSTPLSHSSLPLNLRHRYSMPSGPSSSVPVISQPVRYSTNLDYSSAFNTKIPKKRV